MSLSCSSATLFASTRLRQAVINGSVVVLDLRSGAYLLFNAVASAIWIRLVIDKMEEEPLMMALSEHFNVEVDRLRNDVAAFRTDCVDKKLLLERNHCDEKFQSRPSAPQPPSPFFPPLAAWRDLFSTARMLRHRGFSETYRFIVELAPPIRADFDTDQLNRAVAAFSRAENFFLSRNAPADCLPRSLALFRFLRRLGFPAEHVIGVDRDPFLAHAWVECMGRVLLDRDRRSTLTRLAPIPA